MPSWINGVASGGGASLPTATGAGQAPISTGAGTTYTAQAPLPTATAAGQAAVSTGAGTTYAATTLAAIATDLATPSTGLLIEWRADVGVTVDGSGNVSSWADQSSGGNAASQVTAANRPALIANALNGRPVVRFNGSSNWLTVADNSAYKLSSLVCVVVCRASNNGAVVVGYPYAASHSSPYADWWLYVGSAIVDMRVASVDNTAGNTSQDSSNCWFKPHCYVIANQDATNSSKQTCWRNGGDAALYSSSGTGPAIAYPTAVGLIMGAHAAGTGEFLKGDIAQVLLYDGTLWTAALRAQVHAMVAVRWGISMDGQ